MTFTTSAKPVTYYVDGSGIQDLIQTFGPYLEGLPKFEKFNILGAIAMQGATQTDPELDFPDYEIAAACEEHAIFIDFHDEYPIKLKALLEDLTGDESLGLAEFLVADLRYTKKR